MLYCLFSASHDSDYLPGPQTCAPNAGFAASGDFFCFVSQGKDPGPEREKAGESSWVTAEGRRDCSWVTVDVYGMAGRPKSQILKNGKLQKCGDMRGFFWLFLWGRDGYLPGYDYKTWMVVRLPQSCLCRGQSFFWTGVVGMFGRFFQRHLYTLYTLRPC